MTTRLRKTYDLARRAPERALRRPAARQTMRARCRASAAIALVALLGACSQAEWGNNSVENNPVDASPVSVKTKTPGSPSGPGNDEVDVQPAQKRLIKTGDGDRIKAAAAGAAGFSAEQNGDISLNFVNANVRDVVDAVLAQILHLNYTVDPKVQATITMQTSKPVRQDAVLPLLENALQANGIALVRADDLYRVVPLAGAAKSGGMPTSVNGGAGAAGYGLQIIPLKYASAVQLQKVLEPFVPTGGVLQVDESRNLLLISGTQRDVDQFIRLVNIFDVDAMSGMSFGLFPLRQGNAASVGRELATILDGAKGGALAGVVRIIPIERINSILLVSAQPKYILLAQDWIERLDEGIDQTAPRLYVFYVQNSRAADLAKVLGPMFGGATTQNAQPTTAPGAGMSMLSGSSGGLGAGGSGFGSSSNPMPVIGGGGAGAAPAAPGAATDTPSATSQGGPSPDTTGLAALPPPVGVEERPGLAGGTGNTQRTQIVADEKNNALVIRAKPTEYRMIEAALKKLDILPQQILIEATIAEVTLNDNLQYGLQWFLKNGGAKMTLSTAASGALTQAFPGFSALLGGAGSAQAVLNALSSVTTVNVVSAPHLMVLDHQTAMLQVGDEVPVATQQAVSTITTGAPIVNSIQMLNTGVILRVTPRVNANGVATLEIEQEVSAVTPTTSSTIDSPTIQQRRIKTVVSVGNGETLALGGLIQETKNNGRSGLPFLSDIPILGALASNTSKTVQRTELLVLLTPTIVHDQEDARAVTDELQKRMHSLLPIKPNKI